MLQDKENIAEEKKDNTPNSTHILQLKYNNPEGDSTIGFRYSKYRDSVSKDDLSSDYEIDDRRQGSCCTGDFWKQTRLMTWKNYLVFSRNLKPTIFQLLTPVGICLILVLLQGLVNGFSEGFMNKDPEPIPLTMLEKCEYPQDCLTVGYGVISKTGKSNEYVEKIMEYVALANGLEFQKDVKLLTIGDSNSFLDHLKDNQNKTKYGVVFCLDSMEYLNVTIPCTFEYYDYTFHMYTILYNVTNSPNGFLTSSSLPFPKDTQLTRLKTDMDNGFLKYYAEKRNLGFTPKINATLTNFPVTQNRFLEKADVVSSNGAFYFFFPPMISFVVVLLEIIREKDMKLRKSLLIIGLKNSSFWLSWFITSVFFSAAVSFMLVITGIICRFDAFVNTPFLISFLLFFLFNITMQFMGYFLTTVLKSLKSAYTVSYAFILIGLVMEIFLSNVAIIYYLYSTELPGWVSIIKFVFELYPPFNFSKAFSDISIRSASHFDNYEWRWVTGPGYKWGDLFERIKGTMRPNITYDVPSTGETMGKFLMDILLFSLLAWYFDHVDSSNRGKSYGYFFFFERSYWCPKKITDSSLMNQTQKSGDQIDLLSKQIEQTEKLLDFNNNKSSRNNSCKINNTINDSIASYDSDEDEKTEIGIHSVLEEKLKILKSEHLSENFEGLRILGCSKTYKISNSCCGTKDVKALKETHLEVPIGELFTILGHNGAGKSTLINILTGNISPTSGTAKISNADIIFDPLKIEEFIGLCPQHDILWEELTAKEHIELYANLRNFPLKEIPKLIESKLKEVNLMIQANHEVRTYSGGMKRRLSILLSTIGNPKVIFLDEPTTGLDPVNKRFIWSMVQKMKKERAVILTTHSMEEADFLSDRIGVIVEGRFKCIGTPLHLKQIYGSGYLLTFVCDRDNLDTVRTHIRRIMPSSTIINTSGGSIILNLPFDKPREIKYFISILNQKYQDPELAPLSGLIKECGMDYTTLEEIFLKITSKKASTISSHNPILVQ